MTEKTWTHDGLQSDLARHFVANDKIMVWEDMQLGPSGSPRPDVYTLRKSFTNPYPRAYEIKISTSDFRGDVERAKWTSYFDFADSVTFCVPKGLLKREDVPAEAGLMIRGENGWSTVKAARRVTTNRTLDEFVYMKLLMDGIKRARQPVVPEPRSADPWRVARNERNQLSEEVREAITDIGAARLRAQSLMERAEEQYDLARERREQIDEERNLLHSRLKSILGIRYSAGLDRLIEELDRRVQERLDEISTDTEISQLTKSIETAMNTLKRALPN